MERNRFLLGLLTFIVVFLIGCGESPTVTMVELSNDSGLELSDITLEDRDLGDLGINEKVEGLEFETIYANVYLSVTVDGVEYTRQPVDHVGEEPLGRHEYLISIRSVDTDLGIVLLEVSRKGIHCIQAPCL